MRLLTSLGLALIFSSQVFGQTVPADFTFFEAKIRPVLIEHCYSCHSVEAQKNKKLKGNLFVDSRDGLRKGGANGPAIAPGKPSESLLLKALRHDELRMPPKYKLPDAVIADFEKWIASGAPDPRDARPVVALPRKDHWAFQPLKVSSPPKITDAKNSIDAFVLNRLKVKGIAPSAPADRRVLVRRLYFDLIGLPPTPGEMDAALKNTSERWYNDLVDRLIASPHHGERWAQHWLDVARYADSAGYSVDSARPTMYLYRDFVIKAINDDMPFDDFVRLQLAGDLIAPGDGSKNVATGFCTCGPFNTNSPKEIDRYDELDDILTTTSQAFLGLNLGCARCHDHKYDPIAQTEYYRLLAIFNSSQRIDRPIWGKDEAKRKQTGHLLSERPGAPVGQSVFLERGNIAMKRQPLASGFVVALIRNDNREKHWLGKANMHPRRALADWLVDVEHGAGALTARVIVNRLWQHHFGIGLVRTPNDFGVQGEPPTHPELLDWLASELIQHNWRLRPIHRLIVQSAAYQQASAFDKSKAAVDPDNRLLWRYSPRRLDAESIRDAILSVGGRLDRTLFGPAVYPVIPREALLPAAYTAWPNTDKDDPATWRRSIYVFVKRSTPLPMFQAFDRPDRTGSVGRRHQTTIVPQALHLVNDPLIRKQSELFAERITREVGTDRRAQITGAFRVALARLPEPSEEKLLLRFLIDAPIQRDLVALTDMCQSLLMLNEFVVVE